jgi:hypothetical protein
MSMTRRSVLVGGVAALGAVTVGCRDDDDPAAAAGDLDPADRAALAAALTEERQILGFYDALPDPDVAAGVAREQHAAHLTALQRLLPTAPSSTPSDLDVPVQVAVASGGRRLRAVAVAARGGPVAALLASIAASHLTPPRAVWEAEWYGEPAR